jgi:hypothetical protein
MLITARSREEIANACMNGLENNCWLSRNRHRHGDLDRKHREGDDQAQRQRADRERSRDGVGQSRRGDRRGTAVMPAIFVA